MNYPAWTYQHVKDKESFIHLKSVSWITTVSKKMMGSELEQDFLLLNLMDNVRMTKKDFPQIHSYVDEACEKLSLPVKPIIFLDTDAEPKTMCIGEKAPLLIISGAMLDLLNEEELRAAVAHEIGHIVCGHSFHKLLVENFSGLTQVMGAVPGLTALSFAARLPLYDWFRNADLSADRAALLVIEDPDVLISMIGRLAGGSKDMFERVSEENLLKQCDDIDALVEKIKSGGTMDKMSYLFSSVVMNGIMRKSPWPAKRIKEIRDWSKTNHCNDLKKGIFPEEKVEEDEGPSTFDKLKFWK